MNISLDQVWKRYTTGWVLREISKEISSGQKVAIGGANGSGKSTLVQIVAGYLSNTKGKVTYSHSGKKVSRDELYKHLAVSAAYAELDEELTIAEIFDHYQIFKPFHLTMLNEFLDLVDFKKQAAKQVRYFSSGMKQRLSLGLAFNMDVPLLILDEPTSFLDENKKQWFAEMMKNYTTNKTVIIASNDERDVLGCESFIQL